MRKYRKIINIYEIYEKLNKNGKFEFRNPRIYVLCRLEFADENTVLFTRKESEI